MSHNAHAAVFWKQHLFFSPPLPSHYAVNVYTIQESPCDRIYFHLGWQHKPPFPPAVEHPDVQVVFLYNVTDLNLGNKIVRLARSFGPRITLVFLLFYLWPFFPVCSYLPSTLIRSHWRVFDFTTTSSPSSPYLYTSLHKE